VTQTNETQARNSEDEPVEFRRPAWRPLALALIAAGSARFADWEADRVVSVAAGADD
jgi:hypothetical protein